MLRKTVSFIILLWYSVDSSLQISQKYEAHDYSNIKMTSDVIWQSSVPSLVMCGFLCVKDELCKTLSFDETANTCTGHTKCPNEIGATTTNCVGCVVMMNTRYNCTEVETTTSQQIDDCSNGIGGPGGDPFTDQSFWAGRNITAIKLYCSSIKVQIIQIRYGSEWADAHPAPNDGVTLTTHTLDNDEYVTSVYARTDIHIRHMVMTTNKRTLPECVSPTEGDPITQSGRRLLYISGREGGLLDCLILHWA